jgi:hypothetical protein
MRDCRLAAALVAAMIGVCLMARNAQAEPARGPLRVHPTNPRYFTDGTVDPDGQLRAVFLTGAHTWDLQADMGQDDPPVPFDFDRYLDFLEAHHHNFIRYWAWETTRFDVRATRDWKSKGLVHYIAPHPYARTGPGLALDGQPKFDLTTYDPAYFERLRQRAVAAGERGIYLSVMLFEGWSLYHANQRKGTEPGWAWRSHPYHPDNNINGIDGSKPGAPVDGLVHSLIHADVNQLQAAYIKHVVETVNDLDNILFEVINEGGDPAWDRWVIEQVRNVEAGLPQQHPIGLTGHGAESLASMLDSTADWVSPGSRDGYQDVMPAWDGQTKVSLLDTDHVWGVGGNPKWVWRAFCRGHNPLFMDPYDGLSLGIPADPKWSPVRQAMGVARQLAERINLAAMVPSDALASTGFCLAAPGSEYVAYLPDGGSVELVLEAGPYRVEWLQPVSGEVTATDALTAAGRQTLTAPFGGPAVVHLAQARD